MAPLDRQHQTEFSAGRGNALQACAASLLERPLDLQAADGAADAVEVVLPLGDGETSAVNVLFG